MLFTVYTSTSFYSEGTTQHLEDLGFTFHEEICTAYNPPKKYLQKTNFSVNVELKSLDELLNFIAIHGEIILSENGTITIYDDYIE